jgi:hypothetical protein
MRARYRKPRRRRGGSTGWYIATGAIVVVLVVVLVLSVSDNKSASGSGPPFAADPNSNQAGSHWHTYLGVNICGEWLSPVPAFEFSAANSSIQAGIHSHGDGLIHTHPFSASEEGSNATLGKYEEYGGWSASSDSIDAWTGPKSAPSQKSWSNGDKCPFGQYKGKPGQIVWKVDGKTRTGDPSSYRQQDGETIAIGFLPKGVGLPFPPDACNAFANISDQQTAAVVSKNSPCRLQASTTTTPASTEPPASTEAPATTVAP